MRQPAGAELPRRERCAGRAAAGGGEFGQVTPGESLARRRGGRREASISSVLRASARDCRGGRRPRVAAARAGGGGVVERLYLSPEQHELILGLARAAGHSEESLQRLCLRVTRRRESDCERLRPREAAGLIEALKSQVARREQETPLAPLVRGEAEEPRTEGPAGESA